jgi:hypothetical protein
MSTHSSSSKRITRSSSKYAEKENVEYNATEPYETLEHTETLNNNNKKAKTNNNNNNTLEDMDIGFSPISNDTTEKSTPPPNTVESRDNMEVDQITPIEIQQISNNEQGEGSTNSNPKGKSTASNDEIIAISFNNTELQTHVNGKFSGFIPRAHFPSSLSNKDLKLQINNLFVKESSNFIGSNLITHGNLDFIIINFKNETTLKKYNEKADKDLNTIIEIYNEENINRYIKNICDQTNNNIIKIIDIPINYDSATLAQHVANITGQKIKAITELTQIPNNNRSNNRSRYNNPRYNHNNNNNNNNVNNTNTNNNRSFPPRRPIYKHILITFEDDRATKYLYANDIWSIEIETFMVRILPGQTNSEEYNKRTSFHYTVTGIPLNANVLDLKPLIEHVKGKTCTFNRTNKFSTSKSATIFVHKDDFQDKRKSIELFNNTSIYILPNHKDRFCLNCGHPNHLLQQCEDPKHSIKNGKKIFSKRFIKRERIMVNLNEEIQNNFKHVLQINRQQHQNLTRHNPKLNNTPKPNKNNNSSRKKNNNNNTPLPSYTNPQTNTNVETVIIQLQEKINKAEQMINNLNNKIIKLEKESADQKQINIQLSNTIEKNLKYNEATDMKFNLISTQMTDLGNKLNIIISNIQITSPPQNQQTDNDQLTNKNSNDTIKEFNDQGYSNQPLPNTYYSTFSQTQNLDNVSEYQSERGGIYNKVTFDNPITPMNFDDTNTLSEYCEDDETDNERDNNQPETSNNHGGSYREYMPTFPKFFSNNKY